MSSSNGSPFERAQACFLQLSTAATILNSASDNLGKAINELDAALKKLNLGISSWFAFRSWNSDEGDYYSTDEIGYAKIEGKWGIALRQTSGSFGSDDGSYHEWLFNDAPRALRIGAVENIPNFLENLNKDVTEATKTVNEKADEVRKLAAAIKVSVDQPAKPTASKR